MGVAIQPKEEIHIYQNVTVGYAELVAVENTFGVAYALPGGGMIASRVLAEEIAARMDHLIRVNMLRTGRRLT